MARKKKEYIEIELESALNYLDVEELEMMQDDVALQSYLLGFKAETAQYYYNIIVDGKNKFIKTSKSKQTVFDAIRKYNEKQSA